ncbi:endonuclease V [Amycolatopsis sp. PS_44_ISF1]|uniref:endonuclease V n=1 Tax=Amycolatopsis sp. PS_44_ISF1 TaxID=2974917 RepID=UPI0028DF8BE4|nr:endonuclease V [Amycolatopsis sp. PS_44_ISF1]MDT8910132.1 endonuclease V [Amycolatopsis sp. PS_44_ISF1]
MPELIVPENVEDAVQLQEQLASQVERFPPSGFAPTTATGLDVAYGSPDEASVVAAAAVTVDLATGAEIESATATGRTEFPYISGLFAFRELPILLAALTRLTTAPELLIVDGNGIAHPRRLGLASHLGVLTGTPAIGVAKTPIGPYEPPAAERGASAPLLDGDEEVGAVLRTQTGVKPVFVSIGHRMDLPTACRYVLDLSRTYRLPQTTRLADQLSRRVLRESPSR